MGFKIGYLSAQQQLGLQIVEDKTPTEISIILMRRFTMSHLRYLTEPSESIRDNNLHLVDVCGLLMVLHEIPQVRHPSPKRKSFIVDNMKGLVL